MPRKLSKARKELTGTFDSRTKDSLTYPAPTPQELKAPSHLGKHGRALWRRITSLEPSILQAVDLPLVGSFCAAFDGFMQARESLKRDGYTLTATAETRTGRSSKVYRNPSVDLEIKYASLMAQLGAKLGYSPRDREMITAGLDASKSNDDVETYLSGDDDDDAPILTPRNWRGL
jgi:P27 family predicted phage terminase small subunit